MFKTLVKILNILIMKKNNWFIVIVFLAASSTSFANGPAYSYNSSKSTLYWEGARPGKSHYGTIEVINGQAQTDGERITGGSFEIDMSSIRNTDIGNESMNDRLVNHLKSEDFFHVEKYPVATFEITGVEERSGMEHMVTGNLTIRGNTREISFPAEITMDERMIHAKTGEISLDRTKWEVNHMSKSVFAEMKDNFINDMMVVKLDVQLSRN